MANADKQIIRRRALRLTQNDVHPLYVFALTGEELLAIADISRISRNDAGKLIGYQRPEVRRHVQDIITYLDGDDILFPNSIILSLSSKIHFVRSRGPEIDDGLSTAGILEIPVPRSGQAKPAWIVDGQQRVLALAKSKRKNFPIPVNAFVADEVELQRDQFLRVNNTRPLPRGLITELLPEVSSVLPSRMAARKLPSAVCEWLNQNQTSPFYKLIRRASESTKDKGIITDTSIVKMVEESITSTSGCLFPYRNIATGETDLDGICNVLVVFWTAVKHVFPDDWGKPSIRSRLMHGAGIRSMGRLMDRVMSGVNPRDAKAITLVEKELRRIAPICHWAEGNWQDLNDIAWNDIQNVPRHIRMLSNLLIRAYVQSKGDGLMKFLFPDAQDLVDPSFDFDLETRSEQRVRHRDDQYAHEALATPPYDGMLVSKAIVEGHGEEGGRYTLAQRHRLLREGVREFFRVKGLPIEFMGDCGAFTYVKEKVPPVTVDEVIDFYEACGVDYGVSVDHIILAFQAELDNCIPGLDVIPEDWQERQDITLDLADQFLKSHAARRSRFLPVGVTQGWSPRSYANCVERLQKMGYRYIGLGGMVSLKSKDILAVLSAISEIRHPETRLHLFGVTRCEHINAFSAFGVASFDSTSPLRQAFKHDRENYYTEEKLYAAVRVPQVEGNNKLQQRIVSGAVKQEVARRLEQACLKALKAYDLTGKGLEKALLLLREYDLVHDGRKDRTGDNRSVLEDQPWKRCPCKICRHLGIHVVLFRGAERNRRRGFHNLFVTYRRVHAEVARMDRVG